MIDTDAHVLVPLKELEAYKRLVIAVQTWTILSDPQKAGRILLDACMEYCKALDKSPLS